MARIAVILFNLGGPDSAAAVKPFLFNLFRDPAILRLPAMVRWPLAWLIATRRAEVAKGIYERLGGRSPLLQWTQAQAAALEAALESDADDTFKTFVAMRYWHPMSDAVAAEVVAYGPDEVVLLPLYPQFSTTTTASSVTAWMRAANAVGLQATTKRVCCYPTHPGFVQAVSDLVRIERAKLPAGAEVRLLFSAHGLPKRIVAGGDPYQWQVEESVRAIVGNLGDLAADHAICYQSRVGPLEWIGPSTESELKRAGADRRAVIVIPVAFVSEHSETLVELDIEYRELAHLAGVPAFLRVPTVGTHPLFIQGLADVVRQVVQQQSEVWAGAPAVCPGQWRSCAGRAVAAGRP